MLPRKKNFRDNINLDKTIDTSADIPNRNSDLKYTKYSETRTYQPIYSCKQANIRAAVDDETWPSVAEMM